MQLERRGIPTVTLVTRKFLPLAREEARGLGLPRLPFVAIPHPLGSLFPAEVSRNALHAVAALVRALTHELETALSSEDTTAARFRPRFG